MIRYFGGATFDVRENKIGERALKISERRAVDVMDDDRHARAFSGESSEYSRLAAVRVDDVGLLRAQDFFQFPQRDEIFQRMHGTDEFGNDCQSRVEGRGSRAGEDFSRFVFQRAFGANRRAGNQFHLDIGFLTQAEDGGEGVFLRAADDEPRDDVGDFQIV